MAPSAISEPLAQKSPLKTQTALHTVRDVNGDGKKPVADDYMYAFKYNFPLPTYGDGKQILDFSRDDETEEVKIANRFLKELEQVIQSRDSKAFADLFLACGNFDDLNRSAHDRG